MVNIQVVVGWLKTIQIEEKGKAKLYILTISTTREWKDKVSGKWQRKYDDIRVSAWNWDWLEGGVSPGELLFVQGRWQEFEGVGECLAAEIKNLSRAAREAPGSEDGEQRRYIVPKLRKHNVGNV